jgi:hypothetical protein
MKTFSDVKAAIDDLIASESNYEGSVAADDAAHGEVAQASGALASAQAKASGTAQAKAAASADVKAKGDALMGVISEYEQGLTPTV